MHGPETLDDLIFQILTDKSHVVSHSLDGKISEYHIKKAKLDDCVEEVKELNTKVEDLTNENRILKRKLCHKASTRVNSCLR